MNSIFRRAYLPEAEVVYHLIEQRIHWMDENGISGWNKTDYLHYYPLRYFQQQCAAGQLYVLASDAGQVQGAVILLEEDVRWAEFAPAAAFYVHNLVSALDAHGAGAAILAGTEALAREKGKQFVRLDCAENNAALNRFYEAAGYLPRGKCTDGPYYGILREKAL